MSQHQPFRQRRLIAAAGVVSIGLAGLLGGTAAQAAPAVSYGDIKTDATGSIIIHKHANQSGNAIGDPEGGTNPLTDPIEGAGFTAYELAGIDLTTPAGWETLKSTKTTPSCDITGSAATKSTAKPEVVSDAAGLATIGGLKVGAYLVCETTTPDGVSTPAAPFIVTVPFPDNQAGAPTNSDGWIYDVNVYPKNTKDAQVTKSVDPQAKFGLGERASFPVTATVPRLATSDQFTNFAILDTMDSRLGSVKVESVKLNGTDVPANYYSKTADGANPAKVWFNADGLAWLKTQADNSVVVTFSGLVESVGNGQIDNVANYLIEHDTVPGPPTPPEPDCKKDCEVTPPVHTNWGELQLKKVDSAQTTATLQGAQFKVYAADQPYAADCATTTHTGAPIEVLVNGAMTDVFTSGANGVVNIAGLFVSDSENPAKDAAYRCYWVEETAAPTGYVLPTDPFTSVKVEKGAVAAADVAVIENTKTTVPTLPLTGGKGTMLLIGGGSALLLLGAVLFTVRRRQAATS